MTAAAGVLAGWSLFVALVVSLGAIAGHWVILPRAVGDSGPSPSWFQAGAACVGRLAGLFLPVAMGLVFLRQMQEFRDPFATWGEDARLLLLGTSWGTTWLVGVAASLIASGGFLLASAGRQTGWWMATAGTLVLGAFPAFTGHASGTEGLRPLTLVADTLHVWAAGGWIGGLTLVLLLEGRWRREATDRSSSLLPGLVPAFSPVAIVGVGTLIATGVLASWIHLPGISALWSSGYGRLLSLKVLLVGMVLGLGAINWKRLTPRLTEPGGTDDMRRAAAVELLIAQVVIVVTAVLVRTSPLGH